MTAPYVVICDREPATIDAWNLDGAVRAARQWAREQGFRCLVQVVDLRAGRDSFTVSSTGRGTIDEEYGDGAYPYGIIRERF